MPLSAPAVPNGTGPTAPVMTNGSNTIVGVTDDDAPPSALSGACTALAARMKLFLESDAPTPILRAVQEQTRIALGVISTALDRYSLDQLSLSYNGGKDCLVLLILYLCALAEHTQPPSDGARARTSLPAALQSVYIISAHPFAEVDAFVDESAVTYGLELARYALPMKQAFEVYLQEHAPVKAILVGTRRTDPHGQLLTHFDQTDQGWPAFMRVHPVIDWHYAEIWAFIRHFEIPYCVLYDQGYTSLGGTTDTHPNPVLKASEGGAKEDGFRPAYELVEDKAERLGRDW